MASGALPSHRYRKDSRAASALYKPRRPGARQPFLERARSILPPSLRRSSNRLLGVYVLVFVLVVLGVFAQWEVGLGALLPTGLGRGGSRGTAGAGEDVLRYVDPLIGTAGGGHVFPGATVPYGRFFSEGLSSGSR